MDAPDVRYAKSGDVSIAYAVVGEGPFDLVYVAGWVVSSLELAWDGPFGELFRRLSSFSRLIVFDKRGTGLSDRVADLPDFETRMDDVRAVMDAAGSRRAALMGVSEGGPMTILFAATYPERTAAAILYGAGASYTAADDYPWSPSREQALRRIPELEQRWGTTAELDDLLQELAPSAVGDEETRDWWRRLLRTSISPSAAARLHRMNVDIDVRHVLTTIRVPTLVLHRRGDALSLWGRTACGSCQTEPAMCMQCMMGAMTVGGRPATGFGSVRRPASARTRPRGHANPESTI